MTKSFLEILLFASVAANAALFLFFAGVFRNMMNAVDAAAFKNLTGLLVRYSSKSPFMITVLNIPLILAIPYYILYGFSNWWLTAGLILWLAAGSIAKVYKFPFYESIATISSDDVTGLNKLRHKVNTGNVFQAVLYVVAAVIMGTGV